MTVIGSKRRAAAVLHALLGQRRRSQARPWAARGARQDEQSEELNSDDGSLGRNRRPPDPTALMQEVEWNMASKRTLTVVAGVGAAALAIAGVAIAQNHEANENRIIGKHSERDIPLAQVPEAAMNAARAQLASISKAEQVTRKADGSTLYEIKGKNSDGKTIELFVTPEGQVLGRE